MGSMQGAERQSLQSTEVWKERNARVFNRHETSTTKLMEKIKAEANLWITTGAKDLGSIVARL